jgi:hypothetical protein
VILLGGAVLLVSTGLIGKVVGDVGNAMSGVVGAVAGSPTPSASVAVRPDAPRLLQPTNHYTNKPVWDVRGFLPSDVQGKAGFKIRIYVAEQVAAEQPVGVTQDFLVPAVPIPDGRSNITASIVGPDGESAKSDPVSVVYDNVPPVLTVTAPTDGSVVNGGTATITGKTQWGSTVGVRNGTSGLSVTTVARDSNYSIDVPLVTGKNDLMITATDPAGNTTTKPLSLVGSGTQTTVQLRLSNYRIALKNLPMPLSMLVTVLDPNGQPVNGATVNFALSLPGLPTSTYDAQTVDGRASWTTTVPKEGVVAGNALVTVMVTAPDGKTYRQTASFAVL